MRGMRKSQTIGWSKEELVLIGSFLSGGIIFYGINSLATALANSQ